MCECERETGDSRPLFCAGDPRWTTEQAKNVDSREKRSILPMILGWRDSWTRPDGGKWKPDLAAVGAAIQFVKESGRFEEEPKGS